MTAVATPRTVPDATSAGSTTAKVFNDPLNAWYVAAWDHEVTRKPVARRIANKPLALFRTGDGIRCPDHGTVYNSAGRRISMPAQETINPSATVPSYPVVERYRYVWVWLGDPTLADPALVPDMSQMSSSEWAGDGETIHAACNYQLILDNLMDLTHEEFVHASSIGQEELSESEFITTHDGNRVTVSRWMFDIDAPPFWLKNMRDKFPDFEGKVDRWQIIHFEAPGTIRIDVGVAKAGTGAHDGDRSQGVNG